MPPSKSQISPLRRIIADSGATAVANGHGNSAGRGDRPVAPTPPTPHFDRKPHRLKKGEVFPGAAEPTRSESPEKADGSADVHALPESLAVPTSVAPEQACGSTAEPCAAPEVSAAPAPEAVPQSAEPVEPPEPAASAPPPSAPVLRRPSGPCTPERLTSLEAQVAEKEATLADVEQNLQALRTELARAERRTAAVRRLSGFRERVIRSFEPQAAQEGVQSASAEPGYLEALRGDVAELERTLVEKQESSRQLDTSILRLRKEVAWLEQSRLMLRQAADLHWGTVHIFARGLIKQIDRIDDELSNGAADVELLESMREALLALLQDQSVEPFTLEPGTVLDMTTRRKVHITEGSENLSGAGEVAAVLRPGYICQNGAGVPTVLRKVEVRAVPRGALAAASA